MPKIINSVEQFNEIKSKAVEVRIVRSSQKVKLKLRTGSYLYTYSTNAEEAQDLIKGLKEIEVIEYGQETKEDKNSDELKKPQGKTD